MSESMRQVDLLRAACCVAGADGETSERERRVLQRLADQAGVGAASLSAMIECAETDEQFYANQFRVAVDRPKEVLQLLFKIAIVDGRLRKEEAVMLKRLSKLLEVEPAQFDEWLKQSVDRARTKAAGKRE
ncbi:MAG: TerB family tellurite resistance protein [Planctomycetota bacterium]|nr:TerB family tellurite resistance protein [Planctomycetota bacterium]MDA1163380.1 TerB family tellurite resistance protein [Planctomycetota bacterium]